MNHSVHLVESPYLVRQNNRDLTILAWVVTLLTTAFHLVSSTSQMIKIREKSLPLYYELQDS
jgi:hypothetical protein